MKIALIVGYPYKYLKGSNVLVRLVKSMTIFNF